VSDIGDALRQGWFMFWTTLWALVLGFAISGAVQAWVSRESMQSHLGNHRPAGVARASLYGAVSSSCSYAAAAVAKSLFARGADFLAAIVFMFASTNLVIELGIVLVVLIGWQFVAAEVVGGVIMIALLVAVGGLWFRGRVLVEARNIATANSAPAAAGHDHASHGPAAPSPAPGGWRQQIRTAGGWSDAAGYTMGDLTMLRKEIVIGFVAAGFLAQLVPVHVWSDVFIHGHGFATNLENAFIGPLVALASFVCSVGNVPLAAALWQGGISFGGVVSFIFGDLITFPLLLIYRKQYGRRMMLRMLTVFWLVMSLAGLIIGELFGALGLVPSRPAQSSAVVAERFTWGPTSVLDILALVVFAVLYWLYRNRTRFGGDGGYAKDPVCGMQVEIAHAPARGDGQGGAVYFCSEHCRERFVSEPSRFAGVPRP
jgi:uncharacterized membrane protein YraQ (UPF0718 family)/YHS domain-containing protein